MVPRGPVAGASSLLQRQYDEESSPTLVDEPMSSPVPGCFLWMRGEMIGKGSYGKVYSAFNARTSEIIAVKQVELPLTPSDRMNKQLRASVDAFRREKQTLSQLVHENIVEYLGFEETPAILSLFIEYVSGGTIGRCYRKCGRLREDVTKSFTTQILRGLAYIHSMGIIHQDIKADSILVQEKGVCKIAGFGLSTKLESIDRAHSTMKGTIHWMAPEVVTTGPEGYNSKVDIWSLGCVVLEMWTAKRPWADERELMPILFKLKVPGAAPPLPDDLVLSRTAEHFRQECFEYDQRRRPTADTLLGHPYLELDDHWVFPGIQNLGEFEPTLDK